MLNKAGVPSGPIYKMNEVFADPQVKHLAMTRTVPHKVLGDVEVVGQPIELSRTPWSIRSATPEAGEHTDAMLTELGYSAEEIASCVRGRWFRVTTGSATFQVVVRQCWPSEPRCGGWGGGHDD